MVTIGGSQRVTSSAAIQGARAFQAARSGMEWAIFRAINDSTCATINNSNFTLAGDGLNGFNVALTCQLTTHIEAGNNISVFSLSSTATSSVFGSADYVRRRLTATISPPT